MDLLLLKLRDSLSDVFEHGHNFFWRRLTVSIAVDKKGCHRSSDQAEAANPHDHHHATEGERAPSGQYPTPRRPRRRSPRSA